MTHLLHLCCEEGITAELVLAALIDAGAPPEVVQAPVDRAGLDAQVVAREVVARHVGATSVDVEVAPAAPRLARVDDLRGAVGRSGLPDAAAAMAAAQVDALLGAEAAVHRSEVDRVRLHELGSPRTAARIIAIAAALQHLAVTVLTVGPVTVGTGSVHIAHGRFPVPPPAVLELLRGFVITAGHVGGEATTPSGAAVLAALARPVDGVPPMRLDGHGRGAADAGGPAERLLTVLLGGPTS